MNPLDNQKLREDVGRKIAILGTKSGKIVVELDQSNGTIIKYGIRVEFARENVER